MRKGIYIPPRVCTSSCLTNHGDIFNSRQILQEKLKLVTPLHRYSFRVRLGAGEIGRRATVRPSETEISTLCLLCFLLFMLLFTEVLWYLAKTWSCVRSRGTAQPVPIRRTIIQTVWSPARRDKDKTLSSSWRYILTLHWVGTTYRQRNYSSSQAKTVLSSGA